MVKKISYILIAVAVATIGFIGIKKLNYWERSVWIFKMNNSTMAFEGRGGRERGEFSGGPGPDSPRNFEAQRPRTMPDSLRRQFESRGGRPDMRNRNIPDSLRREQFRGNNRGQTGAPPFEQDFRRGEGRGRGDFYGGKKINLNKVLWFTAAFAFFTVIMIYIDKAYCIVFIRSKKPEPKS